MAGYLPICKLSCISSMGSQFRKIYSGTLYVQLSFTIVISAEFGASIVLFIKLFFGSRAPLSNKHIFAAANTEVIPTLGVMKISDNQTKLKYTGKKRHI